MLKNTEFEAKDQHLSLTEKKGAFGERYLKKICFSVNGRWYKNTWKMNMVNIIADIITMLALINKILRKQWLN